MLVEGSRDLIQCPFPDPVLDQRRDLVAVDEARALVAEVDTVPALDCGERIRKSGGLAEADPLARRERRDHQVAAVARAEVAPVRSEQIVAQPGPRLVDELSLGEEAEAPRNG